MSISSARAFPGYLLAFVLAGVVSVFAAEAAFRTLGDEPSVDLKGLFVQFGDKGYKLRPRVETSADHASGRFSVITDDLGLRCDDARRLATKPGDTIDVLFVGDSQGFGNGVSFEDTIAGAFATPARQNGYRVANASVGGHTLRQQLELVQWLCEEEGVKVSNLIILASPLMRGCQGYTHAIVGNDGRLYDEVKSPLQLALIYAKTHAVVYSRVRNAIRNSGIGAVPSGDSAVLFRVFNSKTDEQAAEASSLECVKRFQDFAEKQGAHLFLVYVPFAVEVDFDRVKQAAAKRDLKLDPDRPLRICSSIAMKLGLKVHNLRPVLQRFHEENRPLHLKGDYHYDKNVSRACGLSVWAALEPIIAGPQKTVKH
jgi:hypothetical protein